MHKNAPMLWILKRIRKRIPALLVMTAAHVGSAILGVVFALGTRQVIDCASSGDPAAFRNACLIQLAIIAGMIICLTVYRCLKERLNADLDRDWKGNILHVLLNGDYTAVSAYHSGELINRLNNDVRLVDDGILNAIPNGISMAAKLIAAMAVMSALEPWFAFVIIAAGLAVVLLTALMRRQLKGLNKRVSEEDGKVSGFLQETLEKLLMVQALDVAKEMERRADSLMEQRYQVQRKRKNVTLFANTSISIMSYGAGFAALAWCSFGILNGTLTFGTLTAITQLVSQLQTPLVNLSGVIPQYVAMIAAAERLMELAALDSADRAEDARSPALYGSLTAIRADGLHFSYDRETILDGVDFALPKGSFTVIVGPSGIGKSTLLKLMLGVFRPDSGALYLDCGEKIPLDRTTRRLFAYVPQGNLLLSGTLRENLTIIRPEATEEQIAQAVCVSAMDEYLPQLPQGLDTVLGESGAGLSEGQAQRLAIARAILSGAPILLLDECTSALDPETEKKVLERIRALQGRTCIAVTHRPAATEVCDWSLEIRDRQVTVTRINR